MACLLLQRSYWIGQTMVLASFGWTAARHLQWEHAPAWQASGSCMHAGPQWGDQGYIRLVRNVENSVGQCGIAMQASYPVKKTPNPPEPAPTPPTPPKPHPPAPPAPVACDASVSCPASAPRLPPLLPASPPPPPSDALLGSAGLACAAPCSWSR